jgi:hypothetical protein
VPSLSVNQVEAILGQGLVDPPTFNPHGNLGFNIEWIRLNSCPEAIDHPLKYPTFADWALGQFGKGIDEVIHTTPPLPIPPLERGEMGKGSWAFLSVDPFPRLGKGGKGSK